MKNIEVMIHIMYFEHHMNVSRIFGKGFCYDTHIYIMCFKYHMDRSRISRRGFRRVNEGYDLLI